MSVERSTVVPTMRIRAGLLAVALVANLFVAAFLAPSAHACSCAVVSPERQIKGSDAVFSGEVVSIDKHATLRNGGSVPGKVTIDVQESWKGGVSTDSVEVYGQGDGVNCYNMFEKNETYLVYASRAEREGVDYLKNVECGATKRLADAGKDLRVLGPPEGYLPNTGGRAFQPGDGASFSVAVVAIVAAVGVLALRWGIRGPR